MSRIMAIDYGNARIGIALTDPLKIIASGYTTLKNDEGIFDNILALCREKEVESIVMGIPFDQDSKIGESALKVINFAKLLKEYLAENDFSIPFYEQDERYSTHEAYDAMRTVKVKNKKKKALVDQIAAAKILSDFMNSSRKKEVDFNI